MIPDPNSLDRLMANPSYEQFSGKLLKVFDGHTRIILELKDKKVKSVYGPFHETEWSKLMDKTIIAFVKEGEPTRIFDAKFIGKERAPKVTSGTKITHPPKAEVPGHAPKLKWKKYAEGRMIGEPVKISNMVRGLGLDQPLVEKIIRHLEIPITAQTKDIAYLDFRKVYHFISSPAFKGFQNAFLGK